jgi:hypothetical protein
MSWVKWSTALREKIGRIEAHHAEMAPQLERLKAAAARGALREVEQETERLRATVEQLARAMEPFQTDAECHRGPAGAVALCVGILGCVWRTVHTAAGSRALPSSN